MWVFRDLACLAKERLQAAHDARINISPGTMPPDHPDRAMMEQVPRIVTLPVRLLTLVATVVMALVVTFKQRLTTGYDQNFLIFRAAADHLRAGQDLYAAYPALHADLFKYSPTFALFFAPWAVLPVPVAHLIWTLCSGLALWASLSALYPDHRHGVAWCAVAGGLVLDMQRAQTNALVAALMIGAFALAERGRLRRAIVCIGIGTSVKIFPVLAAIAALWLPTRRRTLGYAAVTGMLLIAAPLLVTSATSLSMQYQSWYAREQLDAVAGVGECWSCPGQPVSGAALYGGIMFHVRLLLGDVPNWPVQLGGLIVLGATLVVRRRDFAVRAFQRRILASLLLFVVVFNPQAESPSFVLAACGVAVWYCEGEATATRAWILGVAVAVISFGASDLVPVALRHSVMIPYRVRTLPCFLIWVLLHVELLSLRFNAICDLAKADQTNAGRGPALA
jgi:Glycosyltransferase family 87